MAKVSSPPKPAPAAEAAREARTLNYLKTLALEALLDAPEPLRITDLARNVTALIGISLSEDEAGGLASVIRLILDSDPRFAQSNRMWDLAMKMGRAEGDRRKPVERTIEDFIELFGVPSTADRIATLTALLYGREPEYFRGMLERIAPVRPQFFLTPDGRIGATRWLLAVESDDAADVRFDNFDSEQDLAEVKAAAKGLKAASPVDLAVAIASASPTPLPFKQVAYVVWERFHESESQALFNDLLASEKVSLVPGPLLASAAHREAVMAILRRWAADPERVSGMLAAAAPAQPEGVTAPSISASDSDVDQVNDLIAREPQRSYRVSELCQVVLETFPGSRSYAGIHDSLLEKMKSDPRFQWVGNERFRAVGVIPAEVLNVPEGLNFDERDYLEEGQQVDKLSPPDSWKYNLAREIRNPLVLDLGDDDSSSAPAPIKLRKSLLLHHFFAGTAYVPHLERSFFPPHPDLIELTLITPEGQRMEGWFNHRTGLLYGLRSWFEALDAQNQLESWSGPVFYVARTASPDEFQLEYHGELEEATYVARERLPQLFGILRGEAEAEGWPLTGLISRILRDYPEGLPFVPIFTQTNIVRRARRDAVASVLSAQRFFTQNPQLPGHIRFDEKRSEKKGKKRGPRRIEDYDEEEPIEEE